MIGLEFKIVPFGFGTYAFAISCGILDSPLFASAFVVAGLVFRLLCLLEESMLRFLVRAI